MAIDVSILAKYTTNTDVRTALYLTLPRAISLTAILFITEGLVQIVHVEVY